MRILVVEDEGVAATVLAKGLGEHAYAVDVRARRSRRALQGIDAGADDHLPKPYHLPELLARIRALLRRGPALAAAVRASMAAMSSWRTHPKPGARS